MKNGPKLLCGLLILSALLCTACKNQKENTTSVLSDPLEQLETDAHGNLTLPDESTQTAAGVTAEFSKADLTDSPDYDTAITCAGTGAQIQGEGASAEESLVRITAGGTYRLAGEFTGQILIEAPESDKVRLILAGLTITCTKQSPILCTSADKLILTLADKTVNTVTDRGSGYQDYEEGEENPNSRTAGAIHSSAALTVNGSGSLTVRGDYHNGIHTKKTFKLVGGTLAVEAAADGVKGKNAVAVKGGDLTVTAGEDGIQCSETENTAQGYIWIEGGKMQITTQGDGLDASLYLIQKGGEVTVDAVGTQRKEGSSQSGSGFGGWGGASDGYETNSDGYYKVKPKGVKAGAVIALSGGSLTVRSTGHAVKSDGTVTVSHDATLSLTAQCTAFRANSKGISADGDLLIAGGSVTVHYSYEGIESSEGTIYVTGGSVRVLEAVDDGFNASAGGGMMGGGMRPRAGQDSTATDSLGIVFTGGYTYVNAGGDGLDSNQNIQISGGTVIVAGPTNSGNGALDSGDNNNHIAVTGGILVAYGASGMAETPEASVTTQCVLAHRADLSGGELLTVVDQEGNPILAIRIAQGKFGQHIVLSCPSLIQGERYTLLSGGTVEGECTDGLYAAPTAATGGSELTTLTLTSTVTGATGGGPGGFPGGGGGGGRPPRP